MVKLTQDSVGKWYLNKEEVLCKCIAQTSLCQYVIEINGRVIVVDHKGREVDGFLEYNLMSEYTPRRKKDDVIADLLVHCEKRLSFLKKIGGKHEVPAMEALIKEAKQTLENE